MDVLLLLLPRRHVCVRHTSIFVCFRISTLLVGPTYVAAVCTMHMRQHKWHTWHSARKRGSPRVPHATELQIYFWIARHPASCTFFDRRATKEAWHSSRRIPKAWCIGDCIGTGQQQCEGGEEHWHARRPLWNQLRGRSCCVFVCTLDIVIFARVCLCNMDGWMNGWMVWNGMECIDGSYISANRIRCIARMDSFSSVVYVGMLVFSCAFATKACTIIIVSFGTNSSQERRLSGVATNRLLPKHQRRKLIIVIIIMEQFIAMVLAFCEEPKEFRINNSNFVRTSLSWFYPPPPPNPFYAALHKHCVI